MSKIKVAIIHNIIAPYRFPLFNELAKMNIDLTVLFMAKSSKNRKWDPDLYKDTIKFKYKILPNIKIRLPIADYTEYIINPTIFSELRKYDCVITAGWLDFSCQMTYFFSKIFGYSYIIWSESTEGEDSWQRKLAAPYVKWAVKNAAGLIAIGSRSKKYLLSLGANENKIATAFSTVDIDHFSTRSKVSIQRKYELKKELNIPINHKVILYVGQFIKRKNVLTLIKAFSLLKGNFSLLLVGYGPEKDTLQDYIFRNKILNVVFLPHQEVDKMPEYYGISDVFVLPSLEETWGLVVNEAMASGLPVIISNNVGSADDLVLEGENGYRFAPLDCKHLTKLLNLILFDEKQIHKMSKNSHEHALNFSPEKAAHSFLNAILSVNKV